jgi:ribosomal protein S13
LVIVAHRDPLEYPATPERSLDQRIDALNRANEIRTLRAQLKRDLKAGTASIQALLLDPPAYLQTAKVLEILLALPKIGKVKATKILDSCRVSPSKTIGGLTDRQRAELAARLAMERPGPLRSFTVSPTRGRVTRWRREQLVAAARIARSRTSSVRSV